MKYYVLAPGLFAKSVFLELAYLSGPNSGAATAPLPVPRAATAPLPVPRAATAPSTCAVTSLHHKPPWTCGPVLLHTCITPVPNPGYMKATALARAAFLCGKTGVKRFWLKYKAFSATAPSILHQKTPASRPWGLTVKPAAPLLMCVCS